MGERNSAATFGHFGGSGTFVWIDPVAELGLVVLTDREFGAWGLRTWPSFSDAVLAAAGDAR
jgi:CubicO group peptidase (beta-lactamase class C family)